MFGLSYLKNVATLKLDTGKCIGCRMCEKVCPHNVFIISGKKSHIQKLNACMECGACAKNCPTNALFVQSGVGCASGIIKGIINGTEPTCDCESC